MPGRKPVFASQRKDRPATTEATSINTFAVHRPRQKRRVTSVSHTETTAASATKPPTRSLLPHAQ